MNCEFPAMSRSFLHARLRVAIRIVCAVDRVDVEYSTLAFWSGELDDGKPALAIPIHRAGPDIEFLTEVTPQE
jgi:hypothetical protein